MDSLEVVAGLEVHLQVGVGGKLFCGCEVRYGAPPNSLVCPVCLGLPGALPVPRREAVAEAVRLAVALGCEVAERSGWARKSYGYPDLPKGYQVTQYERPLGTGGELPRLAGGAVRLRRLHLEEDAGRLVHADAATFVDFNRAGVPLVEVVTEPEIGGPEEAEDLLRSLHRLVVALGVSEGNLDQGHLRCDANLSLRRPGEPLGTKVEIKNLNSFRHVARALAAEARRQRQVLASGGAVEEETRGFDEATRETVPLRGKEAAADYRYLPEPDLPPLVVAAAEVERARGALPELPWQRQRRWMAAGVDEAAAVVLLAEPALADHLDAAVASRPGLEAAVARWLRGEVMAELNARGETVAAAPPPAHLGSLVASVEAGELSHSAAKRVLAATWESGEDPETATERLGLALVRDAGAIEAWVEEALAAEPELAERLRRGEDKLLDLFVGRVLGRSGGSADPRRVRRALAAAAGGPLAAAVER
jgi:aspartyl-tRNA(Asn)/glutamyl-tRNA(Gln) amidotransferase subunit B